MKAARQSATATAPATVANVGPGFDVLGFALAEPVVRVRVERGNAHGRQVLVETANTAIPTDPAHNTASGAVAAYMVHCGWSDDLVIHIDAGIPISSGMGSSAASAVAAVVAADALFGTRLPPDILMTCALAGEELASHMRHADNVAPALVGGMTVVRSHEPLDWVALPVPAILRYVVVHPAWTVHTAEARRALPRQIPLEAATRQWAQVAALVAGLCTNNIALIGRALDDQLIEPVRGVMIPGYAQVKAAAVAAGALGCAISGSGPSMFALLDGPEQIQVVARAMCQAFADHGVRTQWWSGALGCAGAQIVND